MIRVARLDDAAQVAEIYAPIVTDTFISFEVQAPSAQEMRARIAKVLRTHPWLVHEEGSRIVGYAYGSVHRERAAYQWSAEVTCYVRPEARGRGIGRALYLELLRLLAAQGFHGAFAGIALPNEASVRLHESVGFTPIGTFRGIGYKLGAWRDVGWWEKQLTASAAQPEPPKPFTP